MHRRVNTKIFPALHKPQTVRQWGNKGREIEIITLFHQRQHKFNLCPFGFRHHRDIFRPQYCPVFVLLAAKVNDQAFWSSLKDLADKLICSPTYAQRDFALVQVA
ncbi:hypothetical protein D3C85_1419390 [compost metagenome]